MKFRRDRDRLGKKSVTGKFAKLYNTLAAGLEMTFFDFPLNRRAASDPLAMHPSAEFDRGCRASPAAAEILLARRLRLL
jgi:hypothetical protein